jgi:hypothetical protein
MYTRSRISVTFGSDMSPSLISFRCVHGFRRAIEVDTVSHEKKVSSPTRILAFWCFPLRDQSLKKLSLKIPIVSSAVTQHACVFVQQ